MFPLKFKMCLSLEVIVPPEHKRRVDNNFKLNIFIRLSGVRHLFLRDGVKSSSQSMSKTAAWDHQ